MFVEMSYIDPTYAIRSVAANAGDTILCTKLAQHSVHGAMSGYTGFSTGSIRNSVCWIPVLTMMEGGINKVSIQGRAWQRLISLNCQPSFVNVENIKVAEQVVLEAQRQKAACIEKIENRLKQKQLKQQDSNSDFSKHSPETAVTESQKSVSESAK